MCTAHAPLHLRKRVTVEARGHIGMGGLTYRTASEDFLGSAIPEGGRGRLNSSVEFNGDPTQLSQRVVPHSLTSRIKPVGRTLSLRHFPQKGIGNGTARRLGGVLASSPRHIRT